MHNACLCNIRGKELETCSSNFNPVRLSVLPLVKDGCSRVVGADLHVGLWALIDLHTKTDH